VGGSDTLLHGIEDNIGVNDGPAAGQTVPHLHVHLIPRYAGDDADPRGFFLAPSRPPGFLKR